jgi:mutator protein MutT
MDGSQVRQRVAGIIMKNQKILLMRRRKDSREFYVFPGGGVEKGESLEEGLKREIIEETGLTIESFRLLFEMDSTFPEQQSGSNQKEYYFLVEAFSGTSELGEPEKTRMTTHNQYHLEWVDIGKIGTMPNLYPQQAVKQLITFLN